MTEELPHIEDLDDLLGGGQEAVTACRRLASHKGTGSLAKLLVGALHAASDVRYMAIQAIGQHGGKIALRALIVLMGSADPDTRAWAADALGHYRGRHVEDVLVNALRDGHARVRQCALGSLGCAGSGKAVPAVAAALDDPSPAVRMWAAGALESLYIPYRHRKCVREALLARLQRERFGGARAGLCGALYRLGYEPALSRLLSLVRQGSPHASWLARDTLRDLATEGFLTPAGIGAAIRALDAALRAATSDEHANHIRDTRAQLLELRGQ